MKVKGQRLEIVDPVKIAATRRVTRLITWLIRVNTLSLPPQGDKSNFPKFILFDGAEVYVRPIKFFFSNSVISWVNTYFVPDFIIVQK